MLAGRLLMVGCGNMGRAMLDRWLASGMSPEDVTVVSPSHRTMPAGVTVTATMPQPDGALPGGGFDVIVLALKPQQLAALRDSHLAAHAPRILLSILAGVEASTLATLSGAAAIVRAMPNLPVAIGKGVIALQTSDDAARATAEALAAPLGHYEWIADESSFDSVTALAGCGPGFVFRFADALTQAGIALGLPADQAMRLALATLEGSALMAAASGSSPATLADRVASPGGSTREGLNVLDRDDTLVTLLTRTLAASATRNAEMATAAR